MALFQGTLKGDAHGNNFAGFFNSEQHISILFLPHKNIFSMLFQKVCTPFNLQSFHCGAFKGNRIGMIPPEWNAVSLHTIGPLSSAHCDQMTKQKNILEMSTGKICKVFYSCNVIFLFFFNKYKCFSIRN